MLLKRVLAWIALIFFLFIVVNILFIHVYVTESATIFLLYVLFFFFGSRKNFFQKPDVSGNPEGPGEHSETGVDVDTEVETEPTGEEEQKDGEESSGV